MVRIFYIRGMGLDSKPQDSQLTVEFLRHRGKNLSYILKPYSVTMAKLDGSAIKDVWMPIIEKEKLETYDVVIAHSSGVQAVLRYLEKNKLKKLILLAATDQHNHQLSEIQTGFYDKPFDYEAIKVNCEKIIICNGALDPYIKPQEAIDLGKKLNCEVLIFKNQKHLTEWHMPQTMNRINESVPNIILKKIVDRILKN